MTDRSQGHAWRTLQVPRISEDAVGEFAYGSPPILQGLHICKAIMQ